MTKVHLAITIGCLAVFACSSRETPSRQWQASDHAQPPQQAIDPARVPAKTNAEDDLAANLWRIHCVSCHAKDGSGRGGAVQIGKNFRDLEWQKSISDADIARAIRVGTPPMPAFEALFSEQDIQSLVLFIRKLGLPQGHP